MNELKAKKIQNKQNYLTSEEIKNKMEEIQKINVSKRKQST